MKIKIYNLKCLLTLAALACIRASPVSLHRAIAIHGGGRSKSAPVVIAKNPESPFQAFLETIRESRKHLVAAAVARCTSISVMFPVDTIKTRLQMSQANPFALVGLYKGVGSSLIGQVPYG